MADTQEPKTIEKEPEKLTVVTQLQQRQENFLVGISNIYTANPIHTIIDSGSVNSKITESIKLDTNIKTIDAAATFQMQERATTESYFTTVVGTGGLAITLSPKTLRNFSINTTNAFTVYVCLYDTGLVPVSTDTPILVFPITSANNIVFNSFNHHFLHGIGIRALLSYPESSINWNPSPYTVFVNMTLSD